MQIIIRLSLSIILGIIALSMVVLFSMAGWDLMQARSTKAYLKNTTCSDMGRMIQQKDVASTEELFAKFLKTSAPAMTAIDKDLKNSEITFNDLVFLCFKTPQKPLYDILTQNDETSLFSSIEDVYNVQDSTFQGMHRKEENTVPSEGQPSPEKQLNPADTFMPEETPQ